MVGVKARRLVLPRDVVPNDVPDAGQAAADFESVAVPVAAAAVRYREAPLDGDRNLLRDEVVSVVRVVPRPAAADDRARPAGLVMDAESVAVLAVALAAVLVVVVVRIAVEDQVATVARVDEQPRPEPVVEIEQLEGVVAGVLGAQQRVRMAPAGAHLGVGDLEAPQVH